MIEPSFTAERRFPTIRMALENILPGKTTRVSEISRALT